MPLNLSNAVVYDVECFPNVFTIAMELLYSDDKCVWEISEFRDDRVALFQWFEFLRSTQNPMFGFFSLAYDYPLIHFIYTHPNCTNAEIYEKSMQLINDFAGRFGSMIWQSDRFAPQIDIFKINHFDNKSKTTSLKALEINMRSHSVVDMPVELNKPLNQNEIGGLLIPYNQHDVSETKRFVLNCMTAVQFRAGLMDQLSGDVMNYNDTKIGEQILIQRIGEDVCFTRARGKKEPRQTIRNRIVLRDIILPYIKFNNPEFNRVLTWLKDQTLTPEDLTDPDAPATTKGVFTGVVANVDGIEFKFGTGGMHASVKPQRLYAGDGWELEDVDVGGYYPAFAIVNRLAPAHLGDAYIREYSRLPIERKEWQKKKGKKSVEANSLKLAGNGVYGKSNSPFSCFYDPQYTMSVTINCQLLLCMLAEWLLTVPTLNIIQANTDGITYRIHSSYKEQARKVCKDWDAYTCLELEYVSYKRMFIRDVNNYIAEPFEGPLKLKGAYWSPDPFRYAESISETQPPSWHKDLGNIVSIRAAVAAMVHGIDPEIFIRSHTDKFDFMMRAKVAKTNKLMLGDKAIQHTSRYYVAINGGSLRKVAPPTGIPGQYKRANKLTDWQFNAVMNEIGPNVWDVRIHTKNKKKYEADNETQFEAGWKVAECNNADDFNFANVNYKYYVEQARKLII